MSCTKKDFVAIAAMIASTLQENPDRFARVAVVGLAWNLSNYFGSQNQAFDKARFLKACGIGEQRCAGCGEPWPCSDSKRRDISGAERAKHVRGER